MITPCPLFTLSVVKIYPIDYLRSTNSVCVWPRLFRYGGTCSVGKTRIENELNQTLELIQTKWV